MAYTHALLSRPEPQLSELAVRFERVNVHPLCMPAFRFSALECPVEPDAAWEAAKTRLLVFTSPRAVQFGLTALDERLLADSLAASVGPATTRALEASGLATLQAHGPDFDSEALLSAIEDQFEPGAAVILAAPGGRRALETGLRALDWNVRLAPVYQRDLLEPAPDVVAALEMAPRVLSVWTSGTALNHLMSKLTSKAALRIEAGSAIVVSGRLAQLAEKAGLRDVHVAAGAANDDLLECFDKLRD